jgi:tetratricopeptide (TPR) repeat protein
MNQEAFPVNEPFDERGRSPSAQRYERARALMDSGSLTQAVDLFLASAADRPHHKTYELLGECYLRLERFPLAVLYLAAATTLNPQVRAPSLLAEAWLAFGDTQRALEATAVALVRDPKNKRALAVREKASELDER